MTDIKICYAASDCAGFKDQSDPACAFSHFTYFPEPKNQTETEKALFNFYKQYDVEL